MGGWLTGLGAGAQGLLGQRAANQEAGFKAQNFALDQATLRIQQQNALLEQQKAQQAQTDAQAKQAAMEALRQKNIQVSVGNGQTMNVADMFAMGSTPKDFAPQPQSLKFETLMVGGKPHRFSHDQNAPNSGWHDDGEAPPPADTSGEKPQLVHGEEGLSTFVVPMTSKGEVVGPRVMTGHKPLPAAIQQKMEAAEDAMELSKDVPALVAALGPLDKIDPNKMAAQAALYSWSGSPWQLNIAHRIYGPTDPAYGELFSKLGTIQAALSKAYFGGRPSQRLFELLSQHMPNPGDAPADLLTKIKGLTGPSGTLQTQINNILQHSRQEAEEAGGGAMLGGGSASEPAPSAGGGGGEWSTPELRRGPDGKPRMTRHNGSGWQWQDPSGAWVPMNG